MTTERTSRGRGQRGQKGKAEKLFDKVQAACLAFEMRRGQLRLWVGDARHGGQGSGLSGAPELVHKTLCTLKQTQ